MQARQLVTLCTCARASQQQVEKRHFVALPVSVYVCLCVPPRLKWWLKPFVNVFVSLARASQPASKFTSVCLCACVFWCDGRWPSEEEAKATATITRAASNDKNNKKFSRRRRVCGFVHISSIPVTSLAPLDGTNCLLHLRRRRRTGNAMTIRFTTRV